MQRLVKVQVRQYETHRKVTGGLGSDRVRSAKGQSRPRGRQAFAVPPRAVSGPRAAQERGAQAAVLRSPQGGGSAGPGPAAQWEAVCERPRGSANR